MKAESDSTPSRAPAFQFYPKDFLTDENVRVMSLTERGAYITLLCLCWTEGTLPADNARLARLCGVTLPAFARLWPALEPCFRIATELPDRLINPRLDRERRKQANYRGERSESGKKGADRRWHRDGAAIKEPMAKHASSSAICSLRSSSADSSQKIAPLVPPDARSKRPIFTGSRFVVFEWMLDDLRRSLGAEFDGFDVHSWFFDLDAKASDANVVVPQRDGGKWLQEQTLAEASRRGLAIAATHQGTGKTAGNAAAAARFIARGQR